MILVTQPILRVSSKQFFSECANASRPSDKRMRLSAATSQVVKAIDGYIDCANSQQLCRVPPFDGSAFGASATDFSSLYESFVVKKNSVGRADYNRILNAPSGGVCPFCATRQVRTVDHFLPKSSHPQFAIAFENLVGCCSDCNTTKRNAVASCPEKVLFHPYYESFPTCAWLVAQIESRCPLTLRFSVADDFTHDVVIKERIRHQFLMLELGELFAFHAAAFLSSLKGTLDEMREDVGPNELQRHLRSLEDGAAKQRHSPWIRAMYAALANDLEFIQG